MATNGLDATMYRGWIDESISLSPQLQRLFSEYVIGTPAYGLSYKGRDLYSYYGYQSVEDYELLYNELLNEIDFQAFEKYEELKKSILSDDLLSFTNSLPIINQERIFIVSGTVSDSKFFKKYFKVEETKGMKKEHIQAEAMLRKKTVAIDKMFYHIRNGLAHGRYSCIDGRGGYIVLQDENNNMISARAIVSLDRMIGWIDILNNKLNKCM